MNMKQNKCPITADELIYVGHDEGCYDGQSYYSPKNDPSIIYAVHPFRNNIYALVDSMSFHAKESRYFRLNEDLTWTEMKRVPHGDRLFPKRYYGSEWKKACAEAKARWQKRIEQEKYWKEHPEEDPRIHAKTIGIDEVKVSPMGPPIGMLFYFDPNNKISKGNE